MKKNTGKVLSLVLALAMVVTSFSATFVSASTLEVAGTKARVDVAGDTKKDYDLVSDKYEEFLVIEDLDNAFEVVTMDRESVDDVEYVSFSKKSGDSLVKVSKDPGDKDKKNLYLRKGVSGEETIVVTMKGTYTDDDTDKEVTVRGTIEIDFTVYEEGEVKLAPYAAGGYGVKHPDDLETAAVNDSGMTLALYVAKHAEDGKGTPAWVQADVIEDSSMDDELDDYFKTSSSKVFVVDPDDNDEDKSHNDTSLGDNGMSQYNTADKTIELVMIRTDGEGKDDATTDDVDERTYYAKVATTKIEMYAPKITVNEADGVTVSTTEKGDKIKETIGVGKKWRVNSGYGAVGNTINKIGARTVIGTNPDPDDKYSDVQNSVKVVTGYEIVGTDALIVSGGNIGNVDVDGAVSVENATVGDIKSGDDVSVTDATVGIIDDAVDVSMDEGAKADKIDAATGNVTIEGASVSGVVSGSNVTITGVEEYATSIGGDVKFKDTLDVTAEDGAVDIKGAIKVNADVNDVSLSGNLLTLGSIDADYRDTTIEFSEFKGDLEFANVAAVTLNLIDESEVTVTNENLILSAVDVEEGSAFTVNGKAKITDISGDGMFAVKSDSLYVNGGVDGVQFRLLDSPANGMVAFRAESDTVAADDFVPVGFTAEVVAQNDSEDKIVVDSVKFAGLSFDKSSVTIAKGYTADVTVAPYPAGTALPDGAKIAWNLEGDDAYINYTLNAAGDTATIEVVDFNEDYAYSNKATLTATIVDEDGYELEGYVAASCDIQGVAVPDTTVTLDTKTVTKNVGEIYQFIAKSSDNSAITASSSDESVARVALYDANDARGYKFQINAVGAGTATITAKNAVGATATMTVTVVAGQGTLKIDTTTYTMAPGDIYDFRVTTTGTTATPVITDSRNGSIVTLTDLGGGKYRITGRRAGTAFITATIGDTRCSLKVDVVEGATQGGVTGNNVSIIG